MWWRLEGGLAKRRALFPEGRGLGVGGRKRIKEKRKQNEKRKAKAKVFIKEQVYKRKPHPLQ